ncbi:uncharacterized protein LOC115223662 isoform X2 [Octopus sinensis]|uniref:Uncharacterized protein LOC115223662 isoform X2 n=1 Tax=Octopus sinensis TaxID=2607531 RepID=A0A7E6FNG4_9MOLL|nr:uncharacterized protein LOC115223662 isoform X2 [Octopus sinensis]
MAWPLSNKEGVERLVVSQNDGPFRDEPSAELKELLRRSQQLQEEEQNLRKSFAELGVTSFPFRMTNVEPISQPANARKAVMLNKPEPKLVNNQKSKLSKHVHRSRDERKMQRPEDTVYQHIKNLKDEYMKNGGQSADVLAQMQKLEMEARLQAMRQYELERNPQDIPKDSVTDLKQQPSINKDSLPSGLNRQLSEMEVKHDKLLSELNKLQIQIHDFGKKTQTEDDIETLEKDHRKNLLLLHQKIEIIQQQKELERHQRDLDKIVSGSRWGQIVVKPGKESMYSQSSRDGLYIQYNFIDGLPEEATICRLLLHWFNGTSSVSAEEDLTMSPTVVCDYRNKWQDGQNNVKYQGFATFVNKQIVPRKIYSSKLCVVVEVQIAMNTSQSPERNSLYTQAWTRIHLFNRYHQPQLGKFSVPLKTLPINAKLSAAEFEARNQFEDAELYYEIQNVNEEFSSESFYDRPLYRQFYQVPHQDPGPLPPPSASPPRSQGGEGSHIPRNQRHGGRQ